MDEYLIAQRAIADLKAAVLTLLRRTGRPMSNAEIGRRLGIYMGHIGHVGHVPRAILALLENEGLAEQIEERGPWVAKDPGRGVNAARSRADDDQAATTLARTSPGWDVNDRRGRPRRDPRVLRTKTLRAIRRELQSIMDSYHHFWDVLAELMQNSRDGIERRQRSEIEEGQDPTPGRIHLTLDAVTRTISVADNGTGIRRDFVTEVLAPGGGDKSPDDDQIGEKGVGLTYVAFSGNSFTLETSCEGEDCTVALSDAAGWLTGSAGVTYPGFSEGDKCQRPELDGFETGSFTRVTVGAVPTTTDVDLFKLSVGDLRWILRTRTAVGDTRQLLRSVDLPDLRVTYHWTGPDSKQLEGDVEVGHPDYAAGLKSHSIEEVQKEFVSKTAPESRRKYLRGKAVTGTKIITEGAEEIRVYGVMLPGNNEFDGIAKAHHVTTSPDAAAEPFVKSGIFVSTKAMPTGVEISPAAMGAYPAYYKRCHFLVESDRIDFDLGRKSMHWRPRRRLQEAVGQLFVEFEKVATYQGDPPKRRIPPGESPAERKHRISEQWKAIKSRHELGWPGIPFARVPTNQEAAVAALFHELLAAKKIEHFRPLATGYSSQYDLHAIYLGKGTELPVVIEFKDRLESIVEDFRDGVKVQGDIDLLVCWDVDEAKLANVGLTLTAIHGDPPYSGVTHELQMPSELSTETIPVIVLRTLRDRQTSTS